MENECFFEREDILDQINNRMEDINCSKYNLSKMTGISQSSLSRFFKDKNDISFKSFIKIYLALELKLYLTPDELQSTEFDRKRNNRFREES